MLKRTLLTALAASGAAYAQEAPAPIAQAPVATTENGSLHYDAAYFAQYAPRTALDMVNQTPGFTLNGGDDRRGFSGAVGNVLIDGQRPSAKSQSLDAILSRIPATQVVRLEILRGADIAGDASGQAVLLNVVRTPTGGDGVWEIGQETTSRHVVAPRAEASYSGRAGQTEFGVGASYLSRYRDLPGDRRNYDASGALTSTMLTPSPRDYREMSLNADVAMPLWDGRFSATGQASYWRFHSDNGFYSSDPAGAPLGRVVTAYNEDEMSYELGANYERGFGDWDATFVGLATRRRYMSDETAFARDAADVLTGTEVQEQVRESGESILRSTIARGFGAQRLEFGIEGAFNTLDAELDLTTDTGGGPLNRPVPNSNVLVEEMRYEAFAVHTWRPDTRWTLESRLARESSTLEFTGDANQSVDLAFWKPSVQLSRNVGERNQVRFRVFRDVDQLDFDDFVSAAAITDNLIAGGNPDLKPETSWQAQFGADLHFPGGAALSVELTRFWISDASDVVLVIAPNPAQDPADPDDDVFRFDAPGNIGDADALELDVSFSAPLDPLIPGGRITVEAEWWNGEVTDPVTGRSRTLSGRPEAEVEIEFRQDINSLKLAWGVLYYREAEFQDYRFNEIDTQEEGPWIDLFIETTALPNNMKLRAWAANILDGDIRRQRHFFDTDRNGPLARYEERQRNFKTAPWYILELSGTF